jgi:hypothetical protein
MTLFVTISLLIPLGFKGEGVNTNSLIVVRIILE